MSIFSFSAVTHPEPYLEEKYPVRPFASISYRQCYHFIFNLFITTIVTVLQCHFWKIFKVSIRGVGDFTYFKCSDAHEKNCNISCQPKIISSRTFLLLKLTEVTSTQESVQRFSYRQIPGLTSYPSTLAVKKSMKMNFSADKICCNFSHEYPKISNNVKSPNPG